MIRFCTRPVMLALGGAVFAALGQPAMAQESTAPAEEAVSAEAAGEIIVTARRRNESLQDAPLAITAINAASLENSAAVKIGDLQGAAPNVLITQQTTGASAANISIRGIAFADIEKSFDPSVGVNIDGVYIGTSTGQLLDFFDIDSIEILRGPQGTLFGRNTIGGVINIRRSRPTGEFGGKFEVSYGKFDTFTGRAVLNVPLIKDILAAKLFYFHSQTDGYYRNFYTGKRANSDNAENFGFSLLFTPTDNFDALFTVEKQVDDGSPVNSSLSNSTEFICAPLPGAAPPVECNRNATDDLYTVFTNRPGIARYRAPAGTAELNWDLGPVKLTSVSSYRSSRERQYQDVDASSIDFFNFDRTQRYRQFSQELRGAGKVTDSFDYVVGAYYFNSRYFLHQETLLGPLLTGAPTAIFVTPQEAVGRSKSYAFFADFDWRFADQWRLSFGGRYTKDKKSLDNAFLAPATAGGFTSFASRSFSKFTPKVSIDFRPTDDLMAYASWSRGFRSGGFNGRGATPFSSTFSYNPETVDAYEIGFKSEFLDRKITLNVAAFYTDYKNIQQSSTVATNLPPPAQPQETVVSNAAAARIQGIEGDLTIRPATGLTLRSSIGYTDAKFKDFLINGGTQDLSNLRLIYAPKITASVSADYKVDVGFGELALNASYRHLSRYDQAIVPFGATVVNGVTVFAGNDPRTRSDTQDLVDASFSIIPQFGDGKAKLTVFGRNLLDDRGTITSFPVAGLFTFAGAREPRSYGVSLGYEF